MTPSLTNTESYILATASRITRAAHAQACVWHSGDRTRSACPARPLRPSAPCSPERLAADPHKIPAYSHATVRCVAKKQHTDFTQNIIEFFRSKTVESNPFNNYLVTLRFFDNNLFFVFLIMNLIACDPFSSLLIIFLPRRHSLHFGDINHEKNCCCGCCRSARRLCRCR